MRQDMNKFRTRRLTTPKCRTRSGNLEVGSVGISAVVGAGRPGPRGGEGESGGGVGRRGGAMRVGSRGGRNTGPGMREGSTKL